MTVRKAMYVSKALAINVENLFKPLVAVQDRQDFDYVELES